MTLINDTTLPVPGNGTTLRQQNWNCIFINSNAERISKLCGYCFILLSSFFGNIVVIIIVYKRRDLRKTINYFIVNMAVSDLLLSLVVIPDQINQMVTDSFYWLVSGVLGLILCKLYIFITSVSLLVSVQSLVWIAIDRFVAVVFPMKLGLISSRIRTIAIVSTWVLAGVFYFPLLITPFELYEFDNNTYCSQIDLKSIFPNKEGYNWLHLTIRYFAPLLLITVLYTAIAITLKRRRKALADTLPSVPEQRYLKKRRQATQMVIVILVLFYICVIPHTLLHFVYLWRHSCAFLRSFYSLAIFLLLLSSVVNPIICLSFVESYRRGLKNIMCYFCAMQDNKRVKRERITLKRIRNLSGKNCERTSKDSNNLQETFDILQKVQ